MGLSFPHVQLLVNADLLFCNDFYSYRLYFVSPHGLTAFLQVTLNLLIDLLI